jgi:hypothetical protein
VNVFDLDRAIVKDYERFARSFTQIRAPRPSDGTGLDDGLLPLAAQTLVFDPHTISFAIERTESGDRAVPFGLGGVDDSAPNPRGRHEGKVSRGAFRGQLSMWCGPDDPPSP